MSSCLEKLQVKLGSCFSNQLALRWVCNTQMGVALGGAPAGMPAGLGGTPAVGGGLGDLFDLGGGVGMATGAYVPPRTVSLLVMALCVCV